jgi:hypothetical protein
MSWVALTQEEMAAVLEISDPVERLDLALLVDRQDDGVRLPTSRPEWRWSSFAAPTRVFRSAEKAHPTSARSAPADAHDP